MAFRNFLFTAYETIFTLVFKRVKKKGNNSSFPTALFQSETPRGFRSFSLSFFLFVFFVSVLNVFWKLWVCLKEGPWIT